MGPSAAPVLALTKEERVMQFGIDCGVDSLTWAGGTWEPGGDYAKKLTVKNVSTETVKLKYRVPETKFFSMSFPELIKLSPGMSVTVSVVFRPIRYERYDDYVEFIVKRRRFYVPVRARLSKLAVSIPDSLDFGFCPSMEVAQRTFEIVNSGEIPASFSWMVKSPFRLSPSSGTVQPGRSAEITAFFEPTGASVFVSKAICDVADLGSYVFKISGIGKYTFLSTSDELVEFGERLSGSNGVTDKEIVLRNQSLVHATFSVRRLEADCDAVFSIQPMSGVVQPGSEQQFRVRYTPLATGQFSSDTFAISTPGGNTVNVRCTGKAVGPEVTLDAKLPPPKAGQTPGRANGIQFGDVDCGREDGKVGGSSTRVIILTNRSQQPAYFHIMAERCGGAFEFHDNTAGVVPSGLSFSIAVTFRPTIPGNYYRRVFCLFRDQMPQFLDFVGTAFDTKHRPQPLLLRHVHAHRRREIVNVPPGVANASPDHILELAEEGLDPGCADYEDKVAEPEASTAVTRSGEARTGEIEIFRQFFLPLSSTTRGITVEEEELDFGMGSRLRLSDKKTMHVTNHTECKVVCSWSIPNGAGGGDDDDESSSPAFAIYPESADIAPGKTAEFRVAFRPGQDNFYYCVKACAYVSVKSNRTFRLVNDAAFVPPRFIGVRLRGHIFGSGAEQFLPKVQFRVHGGGRRLEFPACHCGDSVYQTILVENTSDTPAQFSFGKDSSGIFSAKPNGGLIGRNQMQLVALRYTPPSVGTHTHELKCVLNNSVEDIYSLQLTGGCFVPKVLLSESSPVPPPPPPPPTTISNGKVVGESTKHQLQLTADVMYFKPTCVGLVSERTYTIRNPSRVPLTYQWQVPPRLSSVLRVVPAVGRLMGNESVTLRWSFAPRIMERYTARVPLLVRSVNESHPSQRVSLTVLAEGTAGAVEFSPSSLDFNTALVGTETKRDLVLINSSDCDVAFEIEIVRTDDTVEHHLIEDDANGTVSRARITSTAPPLLEFTRPSGLLPARSRLNTVATFRPKVRGNYSFRILCCLRNAVKSCDLARPENSLARSLAIPSGADEVEIGYDPSTSMVLWDGADPASHVDSVVLDPLAGECLECSAVGAAAYPVLVVDDVRSSSSSTATLWKQLQIAALNRTLRTPLTPAEVRFAHSTGMQDSAEAENDDDALIEDPLSCFDFMFTPSIYGIPQEVILIQLRNNGHLPVSFYFKFPDDLDVELEPWADAGEPSAEELQQSAILDAKLFDIQPRMGSLAAGEACTIRLSYLHTMLDYEGQHEVPVLFTLTNGKQIRIVLKGRTLSSGTPFLHLGVSPPCWDLKTTHIGQRSPPSQGFPVHNPGHSEVEYTVDTNILDTLRAENWNFPVLTCLNPEGIVPGGGAAIVRFSFSPLEPKAYACALPIRFTGSGGLGGGIITVNVEGRGFHPREGIEAAYTEEEAADILAGNAQGALKPPERQLLPLPGQVGALSLDRICFERVPRGSVVVRLSLLTNHTASPLAFQWDESHFLLLSGLLRITPRSGQIPAGGFVTCKFALIAHNMDTSDGIVHGVVDVDIACDLRTANAARDSRTGQGKHLGRRQSVSRASSVRPRRTPARNTAHQSVVGRSTASRDMRLALTTGGVGSGNNGLEAFMALEHMTSLGGVDPEYLTSAGGEGSTRPLVSAEAAHRAQSRTLSTAGSSRFDTLSRNQTADGVPTSASVEKAGVSVVYAHIEAELVNEKEFKNSDLDASRSYFSPKPDNGEVRTLIENGAAREDSTQVNKEISQIIASKSQIFPSPVPTPSPLPPPLAGSKITSLNEDLLALLVRDVIKDASVKRTISELPVEPTPLFLQLSNHPGSAAPTPRVHTPRPEPSTEDGEFDVEWPVGGRLGAIEQIIAAERRRRILVLPECQALAESVLENTIFNLVQEAAHGEIDLTKMPRTVLRGIE